LFRSMGTTEIIIVAIVLIVLFGGKKLPELAHGIAQSIKEFRKAYKEENKDDKKSKSE